MPAADFVLSGGDGYAPPLERERCGKMYGLRGRAFGFSASRLRYLPNQTFVRVLDFRSEPVSAKQRLVGVRAQRSPASSSLEIQRADRDPVRLSAHLFPFFLDFWRNHAGFL